MRQLVIFAVYLKLYNVAETKARNIMHETYAMLNNLVDEDLQIETGTLIKWIVLPVKDQETKIECIYPVKSDTIGDEILEKLGLLEEKTKRIKL